MIGTVHQDPVCHMPVREDVGIPCPIGGTTHWVCSDLCRQQLSEDPSRYLDDSQASAGGGTAPRHAIAYFSMEIALEATIPTYSGGLGVLAGDTLRAAADLSLPMVGVTLVQRRGYLQQRIDEGGWQSEDPAPWDPSTHAERLAAVVEMRLGGNTVKIAAWKYLVRGETGGVVPVLLLDSDLPENAESDCRVTDVLYGGDERYRLAQEAVLGIAGLRMLRELGYDSIHRFQLNEGHSALLVAELLREGRERTHGSWDFEEVRRRCVFTTHTPVPAGHDRFSWDLVGELLGETANDEILRMLSGGSELDMTKVALNGSHYVNGVAKRHAEVSRGMFPDYRIEAVTNGIHTATWVCPSFGALFDRSMPGWRSDPSMLRSILGVPLPEIFDAHGEAKRLLVEKVRSSCGVELDPTLLTIGFARRATEYKRTDLVFHDLDRLRAIAHGAGGLQFVFAGKAHPHDAGGKRLIQSVVEAGRALGDQVRVVYLPNYDMDLARVMVAGCDVWLNTPRKPLEASGTSGMKAAANGVPHLSVLDGWWLEGHIEGVTGWAIGTRDTHSAADAEDASELYDKLDSTIAPMFYGDPRAWAEVMRHVIAINASYFHTRRMVQNYASTAYLR
ncbi:MAG: alpha-glucan family phosphorylase [Planctomycetota bacterium]